MRLRPADIHEQTFRTTFRGFDPVEVDGFLNRVADEIERLQEERANLEIEIEHERSAHRQLEETLSAARHLQESIIDKAREDARVTMNQAKLLADRLVHDARDEVSEIRREARILRERRSAFLANLSSIAHRMNDWVARMDKGMEPEEFYTDPTPAHSQRTAHDVEAEEEADKVSFTQPPLAEDAKPQARAPLFKLSPDPVADVEDLKEGQQGPRPDLDDEGYPDERD